MAVSAVHRYLVRSMFENRVLPSGAALLEIGEANWYGPLDRTELLGYIETYVSDPDRRALLAKRVAELSDTAQFVKFDAVKIFYDIFFCPSNVQAIDFHGLPTAHRLDLNEPVTLDRRFGVSINHGTAEHIFNIGQVFATMHDYTLPGGLMIHESPFTGWIEHGFYNLQPTLYFDMAAANHYRMLGMFIEDLVGDSILQIKSRESVYEFAKAKQIPDNSVLFVALAKDGEDRPFQVPMQGYYGHTLDQIGRQAWRDLR